MTSKSTPCAVIYAGPDLLLAIEARPGRFPVTITAVQAPRIEWVAKDGTPEFIELEGASALADHRNLRVDLERGELLVAEVNDPENTALEEASYHLLSLQPSEPLPMERCS